MDHLAVIDIGRMAICIEKPRMPSSCSIELLRRLKDVLSSNDAYQILGNDVDTWLAGGCQLLAEALKRVLPFGEILCIYDSPHFSKQDEAKMRANGNPEEQEVGPEHCVFRLGDLYLDGDGLQSEQELLATWRNEEGLKNPYVGPYDRQNDWYCPPEKVELLARFLQEKLFIRTSANILRPVYAQSDRPISSDTICAWCNRLIDIETRHPKERPSTLDSTKYYSHFICTPCRKKLLDEIQDIAERRARAKQEQPKLTPTMAQNFRKKTSLAGSSKEVPMETKRIRQIIESAYLDLVNEFRQHNINNSSLDGACLEASVWLKLELERQGVKAELIRYPRAGHWAVQTPIGVIDPTIAWWKEGVEDRPADAIPNSLYWVQKTSPHTKWKKDRRIDERAARGIAVNDATRAFKRFEEVLDPEHRELFKTAAGDLSQDDREGDDELVEYANSITNNNSWHDANEPAGDILVPIVRGEKAPPFSQPERRRLKALKATFGYPCRECNYSRKQCRCTKSKQPIYIFKKYDWGRNRRWSLPVCHLAKPDNPSMSTCGRAVKEPYSASSKKPEGYFPCRYCFRPVLS